MIEIRSICTTLIFGTIIQFQIFGQQRFINNQRMWNDMMFNPAKISQIHGVAIYASHRQQYYSLGSQSPYFSIIGGKSNIPTSYSQNMLVSDASRNKKTNYNLAIGGYYIHSFSGGVYDQNEICGQFSAQVKLNQNLSNLEHFNQLNFGVAIKGINNRYRGNNVNNLYDENDPQFTAQQASNKFAVSAVPGVQFVSGAVEIDAFHTFGPKDQQFSCLTIIGGKSLNGYFKNLALRTNYFGLSTFQLGINKIQSLGRSSSQSWSLNYGANIFIGKKLVSSASNFTNPGIYLGIIYSNNGVAKKTSKQKKYPMKYNAFSGSLNLFDGNLNTLALGPSAELGLMYQRNTKICDCDRLVDNILFALQKGTDLQEIKELENNFNRNCNNEIYRSSFQYYTPQIREKINEKEDDEQFNQKKELITETFGNEEWTTSNLDLYTEFSITLVTNEEDWKRLSKKVACCAYMNFDEKNKKFGLFYNMRAIRNILTSPDIKDTYKLPSSEDWKNLLTITKNRFGNASSLYNCSGDSPTAFNILPSGYYEEGWYPSEEGISGYWGSAGSEYLACVLSCQSKENEMIDKLEEVENRNLDCLAFSIRLLKK